LFDDIAFLIKGNNQLSIKPFLKIGYAADKQTYIVSF